MNCKCDGLVFFFFFWKKRAKTFLLRQIVCKELVLGCHSKRQVQIILYTDEEIECHTRAHTQTRKISARYELNFHQANGTVERYPHINNDKKRQNIMAHTHDLMH